MSAELLINVTPRETRVAVIENGVLHELFVERAKRRGLVANVYKGRVCRVLPGMQAAFVDIGLERTAFLYVNDALPRAPTPSEDNGEAQPLDETGGHPRAQTTENEGRRGFRTAPLANMR